MRTLQPFPRVDLLTIWVGAVFVAIAHRVGDDGVELRWTKHATARRRRAVNTWLEEDQ